MADGIHVSGLAAHKVTGSLLIIKGKVLLQELTVHFVPHVIQNTLGCRLEDKLIVKAQGTPDNDN